MYKYEVTINQPYSNMVFYKSCATLEEAVKTYEIAKRYAEHGRTVSLDVYFYGRLLHSYVAKV